MVLASSCGVHPSPRRFLLLAPLLVACAVDAGPAVGSDPATGADTDRAWTPDAGASSGHGDGDPAEGDADTGPTDPPAEPGEPHPCELSHVGAAVYEAAVTAREGDSLLPVEHTVSFWNDADAALVDGPEIFPALADLIAEARHDVDFATFVWEVGSDPSDAILDGLSRLEERLRAEGAPERPVRVRLLVHANILTGPSRVAEPLVRAVDALGLDPLYVDVAVATRDSWGLGAMHQKLVVLDGSVAHVGGANVEHVHGWEEGRVPWHDTAYVVRGEAAHGLLLSFDRMWLQGRTWTCAAGDCASETNEAPERLSEPALRVDSCLPMIALTRRPRGEINNDVDNPQDQGYLAALAAAESVVKIESPNLNDDHAKDAIRDTLRRGVEVRMVLSLGFNERTQSLPGQGGGNAANVDELYAWAVEELGAGEACRLLRVRWYSRDGATAIEGNGEGASHAKYMSVDHRLVIVGSANMDTQTWNHSGEVNVAVDDAATTAAWDDRVFDPDFDRGVATAHCPAG